MVISGPTSSREPVLIAPSDHRPEHAADLSAKTLGGLFMTRLKMLEAIVEERSWGHAEGLKKVLSQSADLHRTCSDPWRRMATTCEQIVKTVEQCARAEDLTAAEGVALLRRVHFHDRLALALFVLNDKSLTTRCEQACAAIVERFRDPVNRELERRESDLQQSWNTFASEVSDLSSEGRHLAQHQLSTGVYFIGSILSEPASRSGSSMAVSMSWAETRREMQEDLRDIIKLLGAPTAA